jgi:hypothetical protein
MGCSHSQVADSIKEPQASCCATVGCLTSSKNTSRSSSSKTPANATDASDVSPQDSKARTATTNQQSLEVWEKALVPLASRLSDHEASQPTLWWKSLRASLDASASNGGRPGTWSTAFTALHQSPPEDAIQHLLELGVRPWQIVWRHLVVDLRKSLRRLSAAVAAKDGMVDERRGRDIPIGLLDPTFWDYACRILTQACSGEISLRELYTSKTGEACEPCMSPEALEALMAVVKAKRRLLRLQEQLAWLARVVAVALANDSLHEPLLRALKADLVASANVSGKGTLPGSRTGHKLASWLESKNGNESGSDCIRELAINGFELQGVYFRLVTGMSDWHIVCAEVRHSQGLEAGIPGPRLLTALEGLGLRLVAVPALPIHDDEGLAADIPASSGFGGADAECFVLAAACLEQCGVDAPDPDTLRQWCAALPNPRGLLSLAAPLRQAALLSDQVAHEEQRKILCLALCFGAQRGEASSAEGPLPLTEDALTVARCRSPCIVAADTEQDLLSRVAVALQCQRSELRRWEDSEADPSERNWCEMFGSLCEVWYAPYRGDTRSSCVWNWRSDNFALLFVGKVTPQRVAAATQGSSAQVANEALPSIAQRLDASRSFFEVIFRLLSSPASSPRGSPCSQCTYPLRFRLGRASPIQRSAGADRW